MSSVVTLLLLGFSGSRVLLRRQRGGAAAHAELSDAPRENSTGLERKAAVSR